MGDHQYLWVFVNNMFKFSPQPLTDSLSSIAWLKILQRCIIFSLWEKFFALCVDNQMFTLFYIGVMIS
jgi:hypothetical protein